MAAVHKPIFEPLCMCFVCCLWEDEAQITMKTFENFTENLWEGGCCQSNYFLCYMEGYGLCALFLIQL